VRRGAGIENDKERDEEGNKQQEGKKKTVKTSTSVK
jgi:hypothetical protein